MMKLAPEDRWRLELARLELWENRPRAAAGLLAGVDVERLDDRDRPGYLYAMVHAYHRLGDYEAERDFAREWRRRDPDAVMARVYELRALAGLGSIADLEAGLAELRKIEPARGRVFLLREIEIHGLGDVARREGRRQLAEMHQVVDEHPDERWRMEYAALLYVTGMLNESRAEYERILEEAAFSDNHVYYLGSLGRIAARTGDLEVARGYEKALMDTDWSGVWYPDLDRLIAYQRAQIAAVLGEQDRAVSILGQTYDRGAIYGEAHIESMSPDLDLLRGHPEFQRLSAIRG
jgi:tetratricopeptide (TPR) repeat protein